MKHYTFKTKSISASAPPNSVEPLKCDNVYPYITYKCKSAINLNFLFKELVYQEDGNVLIVPSKYDNEQLGDKLSDASETLGPFIPNY